MKSFSIVALGAILMFGCSKNSYKPKTSDVAENKDIQSITSNNSRKSLGAAGISGLNWADPRDNFVDGLVIPSGLSSVDSYNTIIAKTESILNGFSASANGVNTIRIPINPPSALEAWWGSYKGVVDRATAKGWKVIVACWESASSRNGLIDDMNKFWQMWDVLVKAYGTNGNVYFEVFNEPHGYTLSSLTAIYAQFLSRYPTLSRKRIILDGKGYAEDIASVGADSRFSSCLLGLHNYAFWANRTVDQWRAEWRRQIGSYGTRTVITEFGATMSSGKDYQNGNQGDNEIAYIVATSDVCRTDRIASVYWPGLRDGDTYALTTRGGSGTNITIKTVNPSGVFRLRYGWGL